MLDWSESDTIRFLSNIYNLHAEADIEINTLELKNEQKEISKLRVEDDLYLLMSFYEFFLTDL